jgi:LuxR family glucitol operon transcriptional activator
MAKKRSPEEKYLDKKSRLQQLELQIESSGGITKCPADLLSKSAKLRREIEELEQQGINAPIVPAAPKKDSFNIDGIPSPVQFINRPDERALVEGPLRSKEKWVRNIVIHGMGGTGKTVLAMEVARAAEAEGLFNKFILASANDAPITLAELLDIVLRDLGYRSDQLTMHQKESKVSELLRSDRFLLVVDSFERIGDKEVDKFLQDHIFYPSKVLITTRHLWPQGSSVIALKGLTRLQAKQMLVESTKSQGVKHEFTDDEIDTINGITEGLPLALSLIIGQLSQQIPLKDIIQNLTTPERQGQEKSSGKALSDAMFDNLFGNSWNLLSQDARRIFVSMTFFSAPASEEAIQDINRIQEEKNYRTARESLIKMSLLQPGRDRLGGDVLRFSIHPLARRFANAMLDDSQIFSKKDIYGAAVTYFIDFMKKMGSPGQELTNYEKLEQDLPNCLAAFEWCRNEKDTLNAFKIVEHLNHFLFERGFWPMRIQICDSAFDLGSDSSEKDEEAAWRHAFWAGWVCNRQNNYEEAKKWLEKTEESLGKIPEDNVYRTFYQAKIFQLRALITHGEFGEKYKKPLSGEKKSEISKLFEDANEYFEQARRLFLQYQESKGPKWTFEEPDYAIAILDSNQGDLAVDMGLWKKMNTKSESRRFFEIAQDLYSQVLKNARNSNWHNKDAIIAGNAANLGHVEIWLEEKPLDEIRRRFDEALNTAEFIGRIHTMAWCYRGYGLLEQRLGEKEASLQKKEQHFKEAQSFLKKALDIFERIGRRERVQETRESLEEVVSALKA